MKKKQLKEELELANTTLELSMVALIKLDEVLQEAKAQGFVPKNLNDKTEPQAGDKVVETNNSDWFVKNDDGTYTIKLSTGANFVKWDTQIQKETPLADLNKEVQEAKEKHMDLEANWNNPTIEEMANRLIDQCMPLVNGWRENDPCGMNDAEIEKVRWSWSMPNRRKNAIKVAILLSNNLTFFNEHSKIDMFAVKALLQKMLSEC